MRIIWSNRSEIDLYNAIGYIMEEKSPQNALKVLNEITTSIFRLFLTAKDAKVSQRTQRSLILHSSFFIFHY